MIADVVKYFIMGTKESLDRFFEQAQEMGFLEFISLSPKKKIDTSVAIQSLLSAIKILRKQPVKEPYQGGEDHLLAMQVAERIIELKDDLEKLEEEKRVLETEIIRVAPFGNFSMEDIAYIEKAGHRKVQFFCMKTDKSHKTSFPPEIIYVGTEYDLDYFLTISQEHIELPGMIEMRIDAPLGELESRLDFVQDAIQRFETELKEYAMYIGFLQKILLDELNKHNLIYAKQEVAYPLKNSLFIIEAWLPQNKVATLYGLMDGMNIHAEQVAIEKNERVPTYLENSGYSRVGEDIIKVYDIPATTDKDPSRWVLWFFTFFFAVIVSDAGYGLLFLAAAFLIKRKFPHLEGVRKRMLHLFFLLSTACIVWGVLSCSYFGIKIAPGTFLSKISPLHYLVEKKADYHLAVKDDVYQGYLMKFPGIGLAKTGREMIELSAVKHKKVTAYEIYEDFSSNIILEFTILIGIIHLSLAFLRYLRRNFAGLGWIIFMIGGYLFFPSMLDATIIPEFMGWITKPEARVLGLQCLVGGLGFALLGAVIQRRWKGFSEIAHMIQIFADVLSYLRLYALSLAASILAGTFNAEGSALADSVWGLFISALVILAGHTVNMALGLMGGIIHGLRLNFLEWYHYCFEGGGRLFKPLQKLKR